MPSPSNVNKYIYWSCATATSIASLIGFKMFIDSNWKEPTKGTLDFKLACMWQGLRVVTAIAQIYIHPQLGKFRIGDGKNLNKFQQRVQRRHLSNVSDFSKAVNICNKVLYSMIFLGLTYCGATYYSEFKKNGNGLVNTVANIYIEAFNICAWSYVLIYRSFYSNHDLHRSYKTIA